MALNLRIVILLTEGDVNNSLAVPPIGPLSYVWIMARISWFVTSLPFCRLIMGVYGSYTTAQS